MLSGFECDEDQTGWLAGAAVWAVGAAAGCLVAVATIEPALAHWQILALAVTVSLVSLGLRLPVMLTHCPERIWLMHAVWMFGFFAQINWAGFLAARSASGTIAAEAILICLGSELWLLAWSVSQGHLPWLKHFFDGEVHPAAVHASGDCECSHEQPPSLSLSASSLAVADDEDEGELSANIHRELVDGLDENGQRYLSGTIRVQFDAQQRTETVVISFCPALDGVAQVELECDSEDITAKVENATETGARILIRRSEIGDKAEAMIDWFATASTMATEQHSTNLP